MNCEFCNRECKNKNSLVQHQIRCINNPNKISVLSNYKIYNDKIKAGIIKKDEKKYTNQYDKAKKLGLEKPKMSKETLLKISIGAKTQKWNNDRREKHSISMIKATLNHPESYSSRNVSGRTKSYEVIDSFGNETKLNGGWEKLFYEYLTLNKIKWTNIISEVFTYEWENKTRRYFPDFYLPNYNIYVEIKGYQRDRDLLKWNSLNNLIILKKDEIKLLKKGKFNIKENLKNE